MARGNEEMEDFCFSGKWTGRTVHAPLPNEVGRGEVAPTRIRDRSLQPELVGMAAMGQTE